MFKLLYLFFIFFNITSYGVEKFNIELNRSEKKWIKSYKDKKISIYLDNNTGILNYYSNGDKNGLFPSIINLLEEKTGLTFEILNQETKKFEESIYSGLPDIVMGVKNYKKNIKIYNYIDSSIQLDGVIITRNNYPSIEFKGDNCIKKIVYTKNEKMKNKIIQKYGNQINLVLKSNPEEAVKALLSQEADIYIEDFQEALKYLVKNPQKGVKINYLSNALKTNYYIGGKKEFRPLINIIDKNILKSNLTVDFFYEEASSYTKNKLKISRQLKMYIKNKKELKISIPTFEEFPQLYYIDKENKSKGFLVNYFNDLHNIFGLKVKFKRSNENYKFDIDPFILTVNGKRILSYPEKNLITEPYIQIPLLIFNRNKENYIPYFDNLSKYRIGVVKHSFIEKYLLYKGLKENLIELKNIKEVLHSLSSGKIDILIGDLHQIDYFSKLYNIKNLQIAGTIQDKLELNFGIHKNDKTLYFLINSINSEFSYRINNRKKEFFTEKIKLSKDYKISILITLISSLLLKIIYTYLKNAKNTSLKLKKLTISLVGTLENANTFNDEDTGAHIKRIGKYSMFLGKELKLKPSLVEQIGLYASLHDVGKIGIPDNVLKKPGKLTQSEFEIMKNHVEIGYNLMKDLDIGPVALNIIRYHHEKWNGSGYGKGLKGKEIPIEARIVALADVYDALRQERVYKKAFSHEKSIDIIISESGKHFDPQIIEIFIKKNNAFQKIFEQNLN